MRDIKESDWKYFRKLQPLALDRFCVRVLAEVQRQASDQEQTHHERYLQIYTTVHDRNRELARMFDDVRRSNVLTRLAWVHAAGLITAEEFSAFSEETRGVLAVLSGGGPAL